jgi:phage terminase small subunit
MEKTKITPQMRVFAEQIIIGWSPEEAVVRAGWPEERARWKARELLSTPAVAELIYEMRCTGEGLPGSAVDRLKIDNILLRLTNLAYSNILDYVEWNNDELTVKKSSDLTRNQAECIRSIEVEPNKYGNKIKIKMHDKLRAIEMLGKNRGMFKDRPVVENNLTINWAVDDGKGKDVIDVEAKEIDSGLLDKIVGYDDEKEEDY